MTCGGIGNICQIFYDRQNTYHRIVVDMPHFVLVFLPSPFRPFLILIMHTFKYGARYKFNMIKDTNGHIIGHGEYVVLELLMQLFPNREIKTQMKFTDLVKGEWLDTVTERQKKETIDIVVLGKPIIAIRVQDPHHVGRLTDMRDLVQKKTLEWNDVVVVDVNAYDCKNIMKDRGGDESMRELLEALRHAGIS